MLIVERDLAVRKLITSALREQDYRVLESGNISTAIDLLDCWKRHIRLVVHSADLSSNREEDAFKQSVEGLPSIQICDRQASLQGFSKSQSDHDAVLFRPFTSEDLVAVVARVTSADTVVRSECCA